MLDMSRVDELRQAITDAEDAEDIAQAIHEFNNYLESNNDSEQELMDENATLKVDNEVLSKKLERSRAINAELRNEIGLRVKEDPKPKEEPKEEPIETDFSKIMAEF